jgi:cytochrome b561
MSSAADIRDGMSMAQPLQATVGEYRMAAKVFHWVTVALIMFMVSSGVTAKQLGEGDLSNLLFSLHKMTGALTLAFILARLAYRILRALPRHSDQPRSRPVLHWTLYAVVVLVPLLGWAGISDFGAREIFPGYSLPPIWPEGAGYDMLLLQFHAYFAFGLLALVALHIGIAMEDYMTGVRRARNDQAGGGFGAG